MYVEERKDKNGNLISYRLICSGKDAYSGKHKNYTKTFKIDKNLTSKKEISHALDKAKYEFEEEVRKMSCGIHVVDENPLFEDYADEWLENILNRKQDSYNYYKDSKQHLKVIIPFFKNDRLKNIGPNKIQKFYDYLSGSTYDKQVVKVKQSIKELIKYKEQHKIAKDIGINRLTLRMASNVGNQVSIATARAISKYFNVPIDKYFEITNTKCRYSKATINGIRTTLVMILAEAKRTMLIEQNYATKEYTKKLEGSEKQKKIFNEDEAKRFIQCLLAENNIRRKTSLALFIFLGLRKAEVAGMSFDCIDFDKNLIHVKLNNIYAGSQFGIKIKSPKTKKSIRTIVMPQKLAEILKEYKIWWEEQKMLHGDLWENSNFLFLQDNGKVINPCTLAQWVTKFEIEHGFEHVSCHSLRHTATTLMIKSGIPIKVVSAILGHASPDFTLKVYTHIMEGQPEEASIIYNNFLCGVN